MGFSEKLKPYQEKLSEEIEEALREIKEYFSISEISVLEYDENHIVIPIEFKVSIPPRGPVGGIDIRNVEPMMVKISLKNFPNRCPKLLSDREDFPKNKLPHLYASRSDYAALCLVRNSPDEWFSNNRMSDLLLVGEQWLFKAATGTLAEDGEEFDPLRLDSYYSYHSYMYDQVHNVVRSDLRLVPQAAMAAMLSYFKKGEKDIESVVKTITAIPPIQVPEILKVESSLRSRQNDFDISLPFFTMAVWNEEGKVNADYITKLPSNFGELKEYFKNDGIDIVQNLSVFLKSGLMLRTLIPIIHAVKRPKKVIGYSGQYEFINFVLDIKKFTVDKFPDDAEVFYQSHLEPFSSTLAFKLSGEERSHRSLFIGAGSLGSKLILHDAKAGNLKIGVADQDNFLNHNIGRHVFGLSRIGENKAEAIVNEISSWYEFEREKDFKAYPIGVEFLPQDIIDGYPWLIDSTASFMVQNWITKANLQKVVVARCEMADQGNLGLMYIEGVDRNPRLDDLVNYTYYLSKENMTIRHWRNRDVQRVPTTIDIGLGCSSTTTVMADDIVSLHSALFSRVLHNERDLVVERNQGLIHLNIMDEAGTARIKSQDYKVSPFEIYQCRAGSGWQIRFLKGLSEEFFHLCKQKGKIETGGILIGVANYKTKTIHVFEIVKEPQDSKGTCVGFKRGIHGLPARVDKIKRDSGGVIGYIGEWHTHPMDLESLSEIDKSTVQELQTLNRKTPIPTLAVIVTNEKILPFVYE